MTAVTDCKKLVNIAWQEANDAGNGKAVERISALVKKYTVTDWAKIAIEAGLLSPSDLSSEGASALEIDEDGAQGIETEDVLPELFHPTVKPIVGKP